MTSYYSIVQVTGDQIADERINIGLVAVGSDEAPSITFEEDSRRAAQFLGIRPVEVEQLVESLRSDLESALGRESALDVLQSLAATWRHNVQFTSPRASLLGVADLVAAVSPRALRLSTGHLAHARSRDRRSAVVLARKTLRAALSSVSAHVEVVNSVVVQGKRQEHRLDLGLANGSVRRGIAGFSLEGGFTLDRQRELGSLKWTVDDIKSLDRQFPISIVVLPGAAEEEPRDLDVLRELGAELVPEYQVNTWATQIAAAYE